MPLLSETFCQPHLSLILNPMWTLNFWSGSIQTWQIWSVHLLNSSVRDLRTKHYLPISYTIWFYIIWYLKTRYNFFLLTWYYDTVLVDIWEISIAWMNSLHMYNNYRKKETLIAYISGTSKNKYPGLMRISEWNKAAPERVKPKDLMGQSQKLFWTHT